MWKIKFQRKKTQTTNILVKMLFGLMLKMPWFVHKNILKVYIMIAHNLHSCFLLFCFFSPCNVAITRGRDFRYINSLFTQCVWIEQFIFKDRF